MEAFSMVTCALGQVCEGEEITTMLYQLMWHY